MKIPKFNSKCDIHGDHSTRAAALECRRLRREAEGARRSELEIARAEDRVRCGWQTEAGTINSPQFCNRIVKAGYSYCTEHEREAEELYPDRDVTKLPEPVTVVMFRVWKPDPTNGETADNCTVLALFPYIDEGNGYCLSYEHVGGHGSADYHGLVSGGWRSRTRPAKPEEYAALKRELESEPYRYRLEVKRRINYDKRKEA